MNSKDNRNLIIALIILAIGIKIILMAFSNYLSKNVGGIVGGFSDLTGSVESMGTLIIYGIIVLIILLIPFYLSKRSEEKKMTKEKVKPKLGEQ
jgi:uncharacterized membrane protein